MRYDRLILVLMLPLIVACKVLPQGTDRPSSATAGQDGPADTAFAIGDGQTLPAGVRPKPRPVPATAGGQAIAPPGQALSPAQIAPVVPVLPAVQKSKQQISCEKRGGNWGNAGKSTLKTCITRTRDAGKQCRKQGDCLSVCLARSGTCAPVKPLFGCNEILQKDGSRVTLCID